MKTNSSKYILLLMLGVLLWACSTKKDALVNRQFQSLNTKFNVLYNGNIAFDKGLANLRDQYHDNFWEVLPIERMQPEQRALLDDKAKDPDFQLAEDKATKAIQKRSMYIGGREKNPQMDEAYLLLGKARYHDNRFIPALEAFNYILYKYPNSDKINEAKVWREKTNLRLMYDELAIQNIKKMLKEPSLAKQNRADALATIAQAYLNIGHQDSAVAPLEQAKKLTERTEEKARFSFILGQLYGRLDQRDLALQSFQEVIDMNRRAPRPYMIQSHANQLLYGDIKTVDTVAFLDKYKDLLKDRENRPYLDLLNRQVGLFYLKQERVPKAITYFKTALKHSNGADYLKASNYKSLAEIYFNSAKYEWAGQYYDSTLVLLPPKTKEFFQITKKRDNLHDVVLYERTAKTSDSILRLVSMSDAEQERYIGDLIDKMKSEDAKKAALASKAPQTSGQSPFASISNPMPLDSGGGENDFLKKKLPAGVGAKAGGASNFYFYSQNAVAFGKLEFKKRWGNRELKENWRWATASALPGRDSETLLAQEGNGAANGEQPEENLRYSVDFYKGQIPTDPKELVAIKKDRDFAYFQLGSIYSDKFAEYQLAADKLEALLTFNPEDRLVLPAKYNLYKIYLSIDPAKAERWKQNILSQHADSRYAELLLNKNISSEVEGSPEQVYGKLYKAFNQGSYVEALDGVDQAIMQFVDSDHLPKFDLLKANIIGRLEGVDVYKTALNYVALTYAGKAEAKEAERIINRDLPKLNALKWSDAPSKSWKIVYRIPAEIQESASLMAKKLERYALDRHDAKVKFSQDYYTAKEVFFVIHGFQTAEAAQAAIAYLKNAAEYKINQEALVISSENYTVIQVKKNWDSFLQTKNQ
ncbi:tetratricopeptide repeat protein [Flavobacterium sp. JP2137]|uniref:type IX secretion system periplasmic lipoprotein PorW/SprE n=1 Tax=Flavobacterium sp. JP2137 TaxID=3414510 RepID=UPI003D2FAB85